MQEARGEREALLPAARKRAGKVVAAFGELEAGERLVDVAPALGHAVHAGDEVQVLAQGQILPERKPLRHVADVTLDLFGLAQNIVTETRSLSAVRSQQSAEHAYRRGLAAAVGTEKTEDFSSPHRQREIPDRVVVAEVLVQASHVDDHVGVRRLHRQLGKTTSTGWPGLSRMAAPASGLASTR